jgi:hypothetical protein
VASAVRERSSMGPISRSRGILVAILVAFLAGCASMPMPETEGEHIDDTVIPNRVKAAIVDEPRPSGLQELLGAAVAEISRG